LGPVKCDEENIGIIPNHYEIEALNTKRDPMSSTDISHLRATPPRPDNSYPTNTIAAITKRMGTKSLPFNYSMRRKFRRFVRYWVRNNVTPIPSNTDFSIENWLKDTHYSEARREELREGYEKMKTDNSFKKRANNNLYECAKMNFFIKDEPYVDFKYPRGIWARCDEFKTIIGPFFQVDGETTLWPALFYKES